MGLWFLQEHRLAIQTIFSPSLWDKQLQFRRREQVHPRNNNTSSILSAPRDRSTRLGQDHIYSRLSWSWSDSCCSPAVVEASDCVWLLSNQQRQQQQIVVTDDRSNSWHVRPSVWTGSGLKTAKPFADRFWSYLLCLMVRMGVLVIIFLNTRCRGFIL